MATNGRLDDLIRRGVELFKTGRHEESRDLYRQALLIDGSHADAHHLLGVLELRHGQREIALGHLWKAVELKPSTARFHNTLGVAFVNDRNFAQAIHHFWQAIFNEPNYLDALTNLAKALRDSGAWREALTVIDRAIELLPDNPDLKLTRCRILHNLDRHKEAETACREILEHNPRHADALVELGRGLMDRDEKEEARRCFEMALEVRPEHPSALSALGHACERLGRMDEAIAAWEASLEKEPNSPAVLSSLGIACLQQGDSLGAKRHLEASLQLAPRNAEAHLALSQARMFTADDPQLPLLQDAIADESLTIEEKSKVHFAFGKACEDLEDYTKAFEHYHSGNSLKRRLIEYDPRQTEVRFNTLRQFFDNDRIASLRERFGIESELPVFVLGMPRSGTTLVEQILSSHPEVHGAGELNLLEGLVSRLPALVQPSASFPYALDRLESEMGRRIAREHVEALKEMAPSGTARVVDKMPRNAHYVGLISTFWPKSKIILCVRDLRDVCISCYTRYFANGQPFSWDLRELAHYGREHGQLMDYWRTLLKGQLFEVCYEELVTEQESVTRRLIDFCGLEWDARCLEFHETRRRVKTNPVHVRQPIYSGSVGRWERFANQLEEQLRLLENEGVDDEGREPASSELAEHIESTKA